MYSSFVERKLAMVSRQGIAGDLSGYSLKPHQNDLTAWALRLAKAGNVPSAESTQAS